MLLSRIATGITLGIKSALKVSSIIFFLPVFLFLINFCMLTNMTDMNCLGNSPVTLTFIRKKLVKSIMLKAILCMKGTAT